MRQFKELSREKNIVKLLMKWLLITSLKMKVNDRLTHADLISQIDIKKISFTFFTIQ